MEEEKQRDAFSVREIFDSARRRLNWLPIDWPPLNALLLNSSGTLRNHLYQNTHILHWVSNPGETCTRYLFEVFWHATIHHQMFAKSSSAWKVSCCIAFQVRNETCDKEVTKNDRRVNLSSTHWKLKTCKVWLKYIAITQINETNVQQFALTTVKKLLR